MSPAAQSFERILAPGAGVDSTLASLADAARRLTVDDAIALGFWRSGDDRCGTREMGAANGLGHGLLTLQFTPSAAHVALTWRPDARAWIRVWVDGGELPLPSNDNGRSLAIEPAHWCGERFFVVTTVPQDHPLQDWSRNLSGTGSQRGLLLWDSQARSARHEEPSDEQLWPLPWLQVVDARTLRIHPDRHAPDAGAARTLNI
jgi:hypothetical protein